MPCALSSVATRLARIHQRLVDGDLTDTHAGELAEKALAVARDLATDTAAAYWTGRLEEATGLDLWPFEVA